MTVYVDHARIPYGRMLMSHMLADTREELLAMARRIGIAERWMQKRGTPSEHFDICDSKRALALRHGAEAVTSRQIVEIIRAKRKAAKR